MGRVSRPYEDFIERSFAQHLSIKRGREKISKEDERDAKKMAALAFGKRDELLAAEGQMELG